MPGLRGLPDGPRCSGLDGDEVGPHREADALHAWAGVLDGDAGGGQPLENAGVLLASSAESPGVREPAAVGAVLLVPGGDRQGAAWMGLGAGLGVRGLGGLGLRGRARGWPRGGPWLALQRIAQPGLLSGWGALQGRDVAQPRPLRRGGWVHRWLVGHLDVPREARGAVVDDLGAQGRGLGRGGRRLGRAPKLPSFRWV